MRLAQDLNNSSGAVENAGQTQGSPHLLQGPPLCGDHQPEVSNPGSAFKSVSALYLFCGEKPMCRWESGQMKVGKWVQEEVLEPENLGSTLLLSLARRFTEILDARSRI